MRFLSIQKSGSQFLYLFLVHFLSSFLLLFILSYFYVFVLFYFTFIPLKYVCLLMRDRNGVHLDGKGGGENLDTVARGENLIRLYYVGEKTYFQ